MRRLKLVLCSSLMFASIVLQAQSPVKYGSNPAAGHTFTHDGIKLYYELYGSGEPILLVHGNGGSISDMKAQIEYFRHHYKVIAMDSRDQGRSGDSKDKITYEKMADDLAALLDDVKCGPVDVLGWSDGGIEALLLAMRQPAKVKKIALMGANLDPEALEPVVLDFARKSVESLQSESKLTAEGQRELKLLQLALTEPHIDPKMLEGISVPALVMAGDHDVIKDDHTLEIFHHLHKGELCIFPNATHAIPFDDPQLFNVTVDHFFQAPFAEKDRLNDMLKSLDALQKGD